MIVEKILQEDLHLYEILRHPALCCEFINNIDSFEKLDTEEEFKFAWYQNEVLCDFHPYVSLCTARAVGKTVSISSILLWVLINKIFPNDYILYTVPNRVHLEPVFTNLTRLLRNNSFLQNFIEAKGGINNSNYTVNLLNGASLTCRIAGQTGSGANVVGLHTPLIAVDEAGYYPNGTYNELQPSLNAWTPGCREIVSGVPTGLRENNVLYHVDQENDTYTKHRVSAEENPRITAEDKERAIKQYGGEDSDDFVHYFLGQHGKPLFSLFDRATFRIESYPVYQLVLDGIRTTDIVEYLTKINMLPAVPNSARDVFFGIDLGYTEPTAIIILYLDHHEQIKFHARIKLVKVSYPIQERIIDALDSRFGPVLIGMDKGSAGIAVIQNLLEHKDYVHKEYRKIIYPIDFGSQLVLGINSDGEEIKSKTKPYTVTVLQDYTNNHRIIYSSTDLDLITELERMTYTKTPTGDIVYRTLTLSGGQRGEDHFTSALLCGIASYYLRNEFVFGTRDKKRLMKPGWIN